VLGGVDRLARKRLAAVDFGQAAAFLENFFEKYVEYDFTADLEEKLDQISDGKLAWKDVLRDFWKDFSGSVDDIKELRITDVLDALNEELAPLVFPEREDGSNPRICPKCGSGNLSLKLGKYGAFVGCSNYPECGYTRQLGDAANGDDEAGNGENGTRVLGQDPYTSEEITLRSGRFGPYIQRGEGKEAKRSSLPKGWSPATIDHEKALALLALPRDVGKHPESGKMISAGLGRYGPFVLHDGAYANLESIEDVFSIGLNRAVSVIAEKQSRGRGGRNSAAALKELGEHPDGGGKIVVRDGRYGPYVNFGKINATLPKGKDPLTVTVEEAVTLIAEKEAKGGGKKPARAKAAPAKKPAAKKPAAKKPAKKKD
jgi:DNA topoisomerase-1